MHLGVKTALAAAAVLATAGLVSSSASAMPMPGVTTLQDQAPAQIEQARYVCGRWGCRWVPNGYWAPRPFYRPYRWGPRPFYGRGRW